MASRALSAISYLALWPGIYVASSVAYVAQLTESAGTSAALLYGIAFALSTGIGIYLLDRVKLRDAWLDPADRAAHPPRFAFIAQHSRAVRTLAALLLTISIALALAGPARMPWLAGVPPLAGLGVVLYAAKPRGRRRRPKDILLFKNCYVSAGITGFALIVAGSLRAGPVLPSGPGLRTWLFAGATLFIRVLADAVLCDLDDRAADAAFGTATLPILLGRTGAWNAAMITRLLLAAAIALAPFGPRHARFIWAAVTAASSVILRAAKPEHVRDPVDARFGVEALICTAVILSMHPG